MAARRLLISGRVQGVFYRGWTVQQARALGLKGWVRNLRSGDVEALAIGPDEAIKELVQRCWEGPPAAQVSEIEVSEAGPEAIEGFVQRPTV